MWTIVGDPHLSGAHGIKFDVFGQPGANYSLLVAPAFEVNMQLAKRGPKLRFMTAMTVLYRGKSFTITPWTVKAKRAELIKHFESLGSKISIKDDRVITIELCAAHTISFAIHHAGRENNLNGYLNFRMEVPGCHDSYGGLLGQTYQCKYATEKFEWSRDREDDFRIATLDTASGSYTPNHRLCARGRLIESISITMNFILFLIVCGGALACTSTDPAVVDTCSSQLTTCKGNAGNDTTATCECNGGFYSCVSAMGSASAKECANFKPLSASVGQSCTDLKCTGCPSGNVITVDPKCTTAESNDISACAATRADCLAKANVTAAEDCACYRAHDQCLLVSMKSTSMCVTFMEERDKSNAACAAAGGCALCKALFAPVPPSQCPLEKLLGATNCSKEMANCMSKVQMKPNWNSADLCVCYLPTIKCLNDGQFQSESCVQINALVNALNLGCTLGGCQCPSATTETTKAPTGSTSAADRIIMSVVTVIAIIAVLMN
jgi:hypothetical protein